MKPQFDVDDIAQPTPPPESTTNTKQTDMADSTTPTRISDPNPTAKSAERTALPAPQPEPGSKPEPESDPSRGADERPLQLKMPRRFKRSSSIEQPRRRRKRAYLSGRKVILWSFLLPFLILALVYAAHQFYPIGNRTPLTIDLYHQYAPFLVELRDKLLTGQSLLYSWDGGLGNNFYALLAYYLSSPLNALLVFFPPAWVTEAVTTLTLLKIGASGATFAYMLREAFSPWGQRTISAVRPMLTRKASQTATDWAVVLCSTFFALSGFMLTYSWDIMWLDAIALMPLVILGLHRMVRDGKFLLYTLALAGSLICNYYIALFVCIFTALYFPVCYFSMSPYLREAERNPLLHFFKTFGKFAGTSLLGAGISAFITLPTYLSLQLTSASTDQLPQQFLMRFSLFEFMGRHMINMPPSIRDGLPNVFTGVLTFMLIPLYIFAKHIRVREKALHLGLLFFLFLSFNSNVLDFLWHGMHYPNQLPYRYSFVYSFLVLIMCYRVLSQLRSFSARTIALAGGGGILYAILAEVVLPDQVDHESSYLTLAFLLIYLTILILYKTRHYLLRKTALILAVVCVVELVLNTAVTIYTIDKNEHYTDRSGFNDDIPAVRSLVSEQEREDPSFWRMEIVQQKTTNSPSLYGYRGFTIFSSTSYEHTARMMRSLGYHGNNINSYLYTSSTAFLDAMFGIKYILNKDREMNDPRLEFVRESEAGYLYRNVDALSIGFMAPNGIKSWNTEDRDPFRNQEAFLRAAGLDANLYTPLDLIPDFAKSTNAQPVTGSKDIGFTVSRSNTNDSMTFEFIVEAQAEQHYTLYFDPDGKSSVEVIVNEQVGADGVNTNEYQKVTSINEQEMVELGYREEGDKVRVIVTVPEDGANHVRYWGASTNEAVYEQAVASLKKNQLDVQSFRGDRIRGEITAERSGVLFFSIPFDPSWTLKVDGRPVELFAVGGGLMGAEVGAGTHSVDMKFRPPALAKGMILSIFSILVLLALLSFSKMRKRERAGKGEAGSFLFERLDQDERDGGLYGINSLSGVAEKRPDNSDEAK